MFILFYMLSEVKFATNKNLDYIKLLDSVHIGNLYFYISFSVIHCKGGKC